MTTASPSPGATAMRALYSFLTIAAALAAAIASLVYLLHRHDRAQEEEN